MAAMLDLGLQLRRLRLERGFTLEQMSEATQIPVPTLAKYETGQRSAPGERLAAISRALGIESIESPIAIGDDDVLHVARDLRKLSPGDRAAVAALVRHFLGNGAT